MTLKTQKVVNKVRKHHKSGVEVEYFLIDKKGKISNTAPEVIKNVKKLDPALAIVPEVGMNMIEINSEPETIIPELMNKMISDMEKIVSVAESSGLALYPFGTYPGKYTPVRTNDKRYEIKEKILGKKRFMSAMQCAGVHIHFSLPWGVFDSKNKTIKTMPSDSKYKEAMINTYNFYIAADPALATFAQSSPFFQGEYLAKDSRMVMYRSGAIKNPDSLYANFPEHGSLPRYILTNTDMVHAIENRFADWVGILNKIKEKARNFFKSKSMLDTTWSPVRINAHGTTESRTMDANLPSVILALVIIMKFVSKHLQENFIKVKISDTAIDSPFVLKDGELIVPPDSHVINKLQVQSAYKGMEDQQVYEYCSAFLKLGESLVPDDRKHFLDPLRKMLTERKTVSDLIVLKAIELGWRKGEILDPTLAANIALSSYQDFLTDIDSCKNTTEKYMKESKQ